MSPYWLNNTCPPFLGLSVDANSPCTLGNLASYAINVDGPETAIAGLRFAKEHNIRLSIKNTGHDYIGRSNGKGSLALWTHNLKQTTVIKNYNTSDYNGPVLKAGAGVQFFEAYQAVAAQGYRVVGGFCPSVGLVGGYTQSGGYGPLSSAYGLGADNALEFEVVTVDGRHLVASRTENADLYWALSGGGGGNYAVVLSLTARIHADGQVAGASLSFNDDDDDKFWAGVAAFNARLVEINTIPRLTVSWSISNAGFAIEVATLPDGRQSDMQTALQPFLDDLDRLNVTLSAFNVTELPGFYEHYNYYTFPPEVYGTNNSLAGRLIPASTARDNLTALVDAYRAIRNDPGYSNILISGTSLNVSHESVGNTAGSNAVLPAWRDALYTMNLAIIFPPDSSSDFLVDVQAKLNEWQALFNPLSPGGGGYMNECTFDNPSWKEDYFGVNYERLLNIKETWDPNFALWQHTSVGADAYWEVKGDGRLCRI